MRTWRRRRMRASFSTHTRKNRRRRKIIILCTLGGKWNPWIHLCYSINFKKKTWFIFVSFGYLRRPCCRAERGCTTMFGARFTLHTFIQIFFSSSLSSSRFWRRRSSRRRIVKSPAAAFMQQKMCCGAHLHAPGRLVWDVNERKVFQSFLSLPFPHRSRDISNLWARECVKTDICVHIKRVQFRLQFNQTE